MEVTVSLMILIMILTAFIGIKKLGDRFNIQAMQRVNEQYSEMLLDPNKNWEAKIVYDDRDELKPIELDVYINQAGLFYYREKQE